MFTAFDVGFGIVVLISAVLATARGLTREILSLLTWAGSAAIAAYMYFKHPDIARGYINNKEVADIATVAVSFIVSLIILHLITMRIADFVVDSRIGPLDRTLGFVFGVLRGIVIAVVVVIFGLWVLGNKVPDWAQNSKSLPFLQNLGDDLMAALPQDLVNQVSNFVHKGSGAAAPNGTPPDDNGDDTGAGDTDSDSGAAAPAVPGTPQAPAAPAGAAPAAPAGSST